MAADLVQHETVVACVPREKLAPVLSAIHGAGLGRQVNVIDPRRGDPDGRLERLGVQEISLPKTDADAVFVVVPCPGRVGATEALLLNHGAIAIDHCGRLPAREHAWFTSIFGGDATTSVSG